MIQFKEALKLLEKSEEFKEWKEKNSETYLSYGFFIVEDNDDNWKIGYYNKEHDKITTFNVGDKITIEPEEDIFKKENDKIEPLDVSSVKLDIADAVTIANNLQKEEYATETPTKIIAILQKMEQKQVWNITFVTKNFNSLNFKIKSETGRIIDKKLTSLMELGREYKG